MTRIDYIKYIEEHTLRLEAGDRGGGIEIDVSELLKINRDNDDNDYLMRAYQNYLGGGMLGSICNSYSFDYSKLSIARKNKIDNIKDVLNRYFHDMTNHDYDEWESTTYERGQLRPSSAY